MKRLEFAALSEARLISIFEWTILNFGPAQAETYSAILEGACCRIVERTIQSQSCRAVFAPDLRDDLRFARAGQHFIIFIETEDSVLIVDFVHQSSNLPQRLSDAAI